MKKGLFVTGTDTGIGKTVVSAVLVQALEADYWKPVQSGDLDRSDTMKVAKWVDSPRSVFHPETYRLRTPMSPHASAGIDRVEIDLNQFALPETRNQLIVEGAGGLLVPLNRRHCIIDLIQHLGLSVVLVSKHYLGSINHTLLSIEALQKRRIPIAALVFNGPKNTSTEEIIEQFSGISGLFRLEEVPEVTSLTVRSWAKEHRAAINKFTTL